MISLISPALIMSLSPYPFTRRSRMRAS